MGGLGGVVVLLCMIACTKPNPQSCVDGLCTDQRYPFCDVDGTLGGEPQECIAVACSPDVFVACRGDQELRCNSTGNNYDRVGCELGCSAATDGCRLCMPNELRCTNGTVAQCDPEGSVIASEACVLGCYEDQPRCRKLAPSNGLGSYLDLIPKDPAYDFDLINAAFDTKTGTVIANGGLSIPVPSFTAPNGDGPTIRVFVVNNVRIRDGYAFSTMTGLPVTGNAFALVAHGDILIEGRFYAGSDVGGFANSTCAGGVGNYFETDNSSRAVASGGGGNATPGARGGGIGGVIGGVGGQAFGTDHLVPLKGGCPAGGVDNMGNISPYASQGRGGGALQFASETSITILGKIDVRGEHGEVEQAGMLGAAVYGGGAGGSILLEAPTVTLGPKAILMAKGGGGGAIGPSIVNDDTASPDPGTTCSGGGSSTCGNGGDGAAPNAEAEPGQSTAVATGASLASGGGGGGLGRVRINTRDTTYLRPNTAVEAASVTTGLIDTR